MKIMAKAIVRELRTRGYEMRPIIVLSAELISLVSADIRSPDRASRPPLATPARGSAQVGVTIGGA